MTPSAIETQNEPISDPEISEFLMVTLLAVIAMHPNLAPEITVPAVATVVTEELASGVPPGTPVLDEFGQLPAKAGTRSPGATDAVVFGGDGGGATDALDCESDRPDVLDVTTGVALVGSAAEECVDVIVSEGVDPATV